MRVLFFIDTFSAGGKERRLMEIMKGLRLQKDIDFELVVMDKTIQYEEVFHLGIKVHQIIRKTKKDFTVFKKVYKICKEYKPDLVHCWDSMSAIYLIPAVKLLKIKFINGMITDAPAKTGLRNIMWLRAQLTFPFSTVVMGNSQAGLTAYNAPLRKSICIRNGFNFKRINTLLPLAEIKKELGITTSFIVGMVATFSAFKDYKTYFAAASILLEKRKDITFLAIGNHTDSETSQRLIKKENLEQFRLLGRRSNVECYINAMDICVLSTFTEGISNSILEYMALGKPVIATEGGGTTELVENAKTGFLVAPVDPEELAEKIEVLLNNETLRNEMGTAGKQRVHNNFSIDRMMKEVIFNYRKLVDV